MKNIKNHPICIDVLMKPAILTIACIFIPVLSLGGCSVMPPPSGPSTQQALGDWNDVDAAVLFALEKGECAALTTESPDARTRLYRLKSIRDDVGELRVTRPTDGPLDQQKVTLTVSAQLGIPGDRDTKREGRLTTAVVNRLAQLQGVGFAPTGE